MILPLPRTGPSRRCKITVDDEDQVVEFLPRGEVDGPQRFRFVRFTVSDEAPDLLLRGIF